jgi:hypothetical protein
MENNKKRERSPRVYPSSTKAEFILDSLKEGKLPYWMRFKGVNIWKSQFSEYSTIAIFDLYSQKFNISFIEARRLKFSHCVDALRKLEDPNYVSYSN